MIRFDGRVVNQYFEDTGFDLSLTRSFDFNDIEGHLYDVVLINFSYESISKATSDIRGIISQEYEEDKKSHVEHIMMMQKMNPDIRIDEDDLVWPRQPSSPDVLLGLIPDDVDILDPNQTREILNIGLSSEKFSLIEAAAIIMLDAMYRASRLIEHNKWKAVAEIAAMLNQWHFGFIIAERREKNIFIDLAIQKHKSEEAKKASLKSHEGLYAVREEIIGLFNQGKYKSIRQASFELYPKAMELSKSCNRVLVASNAQRTVYDWLRAAK